MDAFSRLQFRENTGKMFNGPNDIPTTWQKHDDDAPFTTVHETGTNEFQFPVCCFHKTMVYTVEDDFKRATRPKSRLLVDL